MGWEHGATGEVNQNGLVFFILLGWKMPDLCGQNDYIFRFHNILFVSLRINLINFFYQLLGE